MKLDENSYQYTGFNLEWHDIVVFLFQCTAIDSARIFRSLGKSPASVLHVRLFPTVYFIGVRVCEADCERH